MLKPKVISQVLRQSIRNGVKASLLMTHDGSLISFATHNDKNAKIYAAIAANIWSTYKKQTVPETFLNGGESDSPKFLLLGCEEGSAFITSIGTMLLCLVAENSVHLGFSKQRRKHCKSTWKSPYFA
ncbi:unnamed protein product [Absidia cylindrospora]